MNKFDLQDRTKKFTLRVIKLVGSLPKTIEGRAIGNQLVRSGTSVGANYRAACRARSKNEFISKLGIVIEEADETCFWIEILIESKMMRRDLMEALLREVNELTAIMVASSNSARKSNSKSQS